MRVITMRTGASATKTTAEEKRRAGERPLRPVTIGSDLSGDVTKPMLMLGGGVVWPAWQRLVIDFRYRYGRIFTESQAITVSRPTSLPYWLAPSAGR